MKRLIPLLLCVAVLAVSLLSLTSCAVLDFLPEDIQKLFGYNTEDPENPGDPEDPENPENPEDPEDPENPANPEKPTYSVTISGIGEDASLTVSEGEPVPAQPTPTKAGYTFLGWYSGEALWNFETDKVTANTVIVAKWQLNVYNVTYELDGGANYEGKPDTFDAESGEITLGTPTKPGYLFSGWYTDPEFENEIKVLNIDVYGDITIYAKWTLNVFNIKYELGGEGVTNTNPGTYDVETGDITLGEPVREGYKFLGWYTDPEFKNPIKVINVNLFANITLYAEWEIKVYNITYELYGGVNAAVNPGTFDAETGTLELGSATRPGYSFDGWYADPDYKTPITHINVLGDVKVYAKWKVKVYNITYNLNGGVNSPDNPTEFDITTGVITLGTPKRDGFAFKGWYTSTSFEEDSRITVIDTNVLDNITVYASWVDVSEFFTYEPYNNRATITAYNGTLEELEIPAILDGFNVTAIDEGAFAGNAYLKKLIIPSTVETIAASAFEGCTALEELVVDSPTIGADAFKDCVSLKKLTIGESVTKINNGAFSNTISLEDVNFNAYRVTGISKENMIFASAGASSDGIKVMIGCEVTFIPTYMFSPKSDYSVSPNVASLDFEENSQCVTIGSYAFAGCYALKTVVIPTYVTSMDYAFNDCAALETVYLYATALRNEAYSRCPFVGSGDPEKGFTLVIGENVRIIPSYFACDSDYKSQAYIGDVVFEGKSGITFVGAYAFYKSMIKSIDLPGVTQISGYAFGGCTNLESVCIGSRDNPNASITVISRAFSGCAGLKKLEINGSYGADTEWSAFDGLTGLEELYFNARTFLSGSGGSSYFKDLASKSKCLSVTIGKDAGYVPDYLFRGCGSNITSLVFEEGSTCTSIGQWAFGNVAISSVVIPDTVTNIGSYAFAEAYSLKQITFGKALSSIGGYAFRGCSNVVELYNRSELVIEPGKTTYGDMTKYLLYTYSDATGTSRVHKSGDFSFYVDGETIYLISYSGKDADIVLPASYEGKDYIVYKYALYGGNPAKTLTISNGVANIMSNAFCGLYNLETLYFNATKLPLDQAGRYNVFDNVGVNVTAGTKVIFSKDIAELPKYILAGSGNITSVEFEKDSICTTISDYSLSLKALKTVVLPDSVTAISANAFVNSTAIENRYGNIIYIANESNNYFYALIAINKSVAEVTIHEDTELMSTNAFQNCTLLESVRLDAISLGDKTLSDKAFSNAGKDTGGITLTVGKRVERIPAFFMASSNLKSIVFEDDGVCKEIGERAFYNTASLTSINIPDSVTTLGNLSFASTGARTITIGNGITGIGASIFSGNKSAHTLIIGDSVKTIGEKAFYACTHLLHVTLGSGVEEIAADAFATFTSSDTSITAKSKIVEICNRSSLTLEMGSTDYGYLAHSALNIYTPESGASLIDITADGFAFYTASSPIILVGYFGYDTEITLPDSYNGDSYVISDYMMMSNTYVTTVVIPDGITNIGKCAFRSMDKLNEVVIGKDVKTIGKHAFAYVSYLTSIIYNAENANDLTYDAEVFIRAGSSNYYNVVFTLTIGAGVKHIPACLFYGSSSNNLYNTPKITNVIFENGSTLESIGDNAFDSNRYIVSISLPEGLKTIGNKAFRDCEKLAEIIIPGSVESIGDNAFFQCDALTAVTILDADSTMTIGFKAFYYTPNLKSVTIGSGVSRIGDQAFGYANKLDTVILGKDVTSMGSEAINTMGHAVAILYAETSEEFAAIVTESDSICNAATIYFYSADEPTTEGNFWHFDEDGNAVIWE